MHTSPRDAYGLRPDGQDPPGTARNRRPQLRGKRLCDALSTMAIAATTVGLAPSASATLVAAEPIADGRNITVFHNIDFVAAFGWPVGEEITVSVLRNGVLIGS